MNERVQSVLHVLRHLAIDPCPSFAALIDCLCDAVQASPDYRHIHIYVLDVPCASDMQLLKDLPVPTSFMVSALRDRFIDILADGDIALVDILYDADGCAWLEYRINTDLFIR